LRCLYSNSLAVLELNHYYIVNAWIGESLIKILLSVLCKVI
jgi:hypothetical protein